MEIKIPEFCLVILVGASSSGKSTFAKKHFLSTEIISSDQCRAYVCDDENSLSATDDAFELLHFITAKRLKNRKLTVIDATNLQEFGRKKLFEIAKKYYAQVVLIIVDTDEKTIKDRHISREDRTFAMYVIDNHLRDLRKTIKNIRKEGFRIIYHLKDQEVENVAIFRDKLWVDKKEEKAPFDIIGDIHGCFDELLDLLNKLGYQVEKVQEKDDYTFKVTHPENRRIIFVGDLVDRGNNSPDVLRLAMNAVNSGIAFCVVGNHEAKLIRKLNGSNVKLKHGIEVTVEQLEKESPQFIEKIKIFMESLISHYVFDDGNLVVSHAGIREDMQGRASSAIKAFCMYGETTGEVDEFGLPVRHNWALDYSGKSTVVYGHTPVPDAVWINNTINLDTGCVFGGSLTALRYPEKEIVSVKAKEVYYEPVKPLNSNTILSNDSILDIEDVTGKRVISTSLAGNIIIKEENSIKALEVMSRYAVNPKWLMYLPPTMSPSETSKKEGYLEYPTEAFDYYKRNGITNVICEEKHMGSRAVLVVLKNKEIAVSKFALTSPSLGVCYTRTGRAFFNNKDLEEQLITRINQALTESGFWEKFNTDWVCLDCEIMPWSLKAIELVKLQYSAVSVSGLNSLSKLMESFNEAKDRNLDISDLESVFQHKYSAISNFRNAFINYCNEVNSINDIKVAPFHILATEGNVHYDKNHLWHMENIYDFCNFDSEILKKTTYIQVDLNDETLVNNACKWWEDLTSNGGEGFVVKPYNFISYDLKNKLLQPAIKCRGKEYLRIIYGYDYDLPNNISRLKERAVLKKRSLAQREFSLGFEALKNFVENKSLKSIHECVFGILALESEEIDPRL